MLSVKVEGEEGEERQQQQSTSTTTTAASQDVDQPCEEVPSAPESAAKAGARSTDDTDEPASVPVEEDDDAEAKEGFVTCSVPKGMKGDIIALSRTIAWAQYSRRAGMCTSCVSIECVGGRLTLAYQRINQGEIIRTGVQPEWVPFKTYTGTQRITGTGTYRNPRTGDETLFFRVDEEPQLACVVLRADGGEDRCAAEITVPVAERPWGRVWVVACDTWKCIVSLDDGNHYSLVSFTANSERDAKKCDKSQVDLVSIPKDAIITNLLDGKLSYVYTSDDSVYLATVTLNGDFAFSAPEIVLLESTSSKDNVIMRVQAIDVPLFGGYTVALYMKDAVYFWHGKMCLAGTLADSPLSTVLYGENNDVLCTINSIGIVFPLSIAGFDKDHPEVKDDDLKYVRQDVQAICPGGGYFHQFNRIPTSTFYADLASRSFMVHRRGECYVVFRDTNAQPRVRESLVKLHI